MNSTSLPFFETLSHSELLVAIVAHTPVGYRVFDRNLRIQYVNDYLLKLRRLDRVQVLGNLCYNIVNGGSPCAVCPVRASFATGRKHVIHRKDILPDGSAVWLDDHAIPLRKPDGTFEFVLEVLIDNTKERRLRESNFQLLTNIVSLLVNLIEKKDPYTSHHSQAVHRISVKFGKFIGLRDMELFELKLGSLLHDLGKIHLADNILNKPGSLNHAEYQQILRHPSNTRNLLDNLSRFPAINDMASHHHERWDGQGYPDKLAGTEIPFGARLIALADTYDAITSDRPYRHALSHERALEEIAANAGSQFDPDLARRFVEMATTRYPTREALLADEPYTGGTTRMFCGHEAGQERTLSTNIKQATTVIFMADILKRLADTTYVDEILANSPCHYVIVERDYRPIFVHGSLAESLTARPGGLVDFNRRRVTLQDQPYPGTEDLCPVRRAFESGMSQSQRVRRDEDGNTSYWDVRAVPLQVTREDGGVIDCVMEIIIDCTAETLERQAMESDIRTLVERLYTLVSGMKEEGLAREIARECDTFGEYLSLMSHAARELYFASEGLDRVPDDAWPEPVPVTVETVILPAR